MASKSFGHTSVEPDSTARHDVESGLPPRDNRMCPGMRSCWPPLSDMFHSYKLSGPLPRLSRRLCMCIILAVRTAVNILVIFFGRWNPVSIIVSAVIGVISFMSVLYALHMIDRRCEEGGVIKCITHWNSMHFNAAIYILTLLTIGIMGGIGARTFSPVVGSALWLAMWIAIIGVGWIARWQPEGTH